MTEERPLDTGLEEDMVLSEIVSRVLDRGAVITGDVVISVAGVDLIQLGLNLYLASAEKARSAGMTPVGPVSTPGSRRALEEKSGRGRSEDRRPGGGGREEAASAGEEASDERDGPGEAGA